jgi:hypothetical protein
MNIIIIAAFAGFGVWLLYANPELIRLGLLSYRWATTEGTIVDSIDNSFVSAGITRNFGIGPVQNNETTHVFEYVVDGRPYRSSAFCFGNYLDIAGAAYLIGTKVPVYYDPKHPEMAVLKRGIQIGAIMGIVPLGIAIFLVFGYVFP